MQKLFIESPTKQLILSRLEEKGIEDFVESLLKKFKSNSTIGYSGTQLFINPCPLCGHNDCFNINSEIGIFNCFSCHGTGCATDLPLFFTKDIKEAIKTLEEFTGISVIFSKDNKERQRKTNLYTDVAEIYHQQLLKNEVALNWLIQIRKRQIKTITDMKTGFCTSITDTVSQLKELGYSDVEIKSVYIPEGLFVYPYPDRYGSIQRFNTKNYLNAARRARDGTEEVIKGHSVGNKHLLFNPHQKYDYAIVVEGEQDFAAIIENGDNNVIAMGGSPSFEQINDLRQFKKLYLCFDSDDGGRGFTEKVNNILPDVKIFDIAVPQGYKDIDDYYVNCSSPVPVQSLLDTAIELKNEESYGSVINNKVMLKNRDWLIEFNITKLITDNNMYKGDIKHIVNGIINENKYSILLPNGLPKSLLKYSEKLLQTINEHYNSNLNNKTLCELSDIFFYSYNKTDIIKAAAAKLLEIEDKEERDACIASLGDKSLRSSIIRELIAIENEALKDKAIHFPLLKPGQGYIMSDENPIAYIYFNKAEDDGKVNLIEMPCLLSSDKSIITLNDYTKVSSNQIVIIDGRFRLRDVIKGPLLDTDFCSLKQGYVKKYLDGEIEQEYLKPDYLIRKFEEMYAKVYYSPDPNLYKVLALFSYATYYADLFGVLPYLYINAQKGTGKSTIQELLSKLCFNSVFVTDVTTAAFIRISNLCSTLIVDEFEGHSSRSKNQEDNLIPLIKSGYSKSSGGATRTNMEETYKVDYYDVFSPKVFAAIGELDDVLRDRSLTITLQLLKANEIHDVINITEFKSLYGDEMVKLSSFAALSALENFKTVYKNYMETETNSESARENETMKPLYTLAKMVGSDYLDAIKAYNISNEQSKEYVDDQSIEGVIKNTVQYIAKAALVSNEFISHGIVSDVIKDENGDFIISKEPLFKFDCLFTKNTKFDGNFIYLNTFFITMMARQLNDFGTISLKQVHNAWKRIFPNNRLLKSQRTSATFTDTALFNEFKHYNVSCYNTAINIADYGLDVVKDEMDLKREKNIREIKNMTEEQINF
jgi:hypothetical protein